MPEATRDMAREGALFVDASDVFFFGGVGVCKYSVHQSWLGKARIYSFEMELVVESWGSGFVKVEPHFCWIL